ncbi:MAG: hypothetical protein F6J97_18725 [Leptolyngbya sp. SIO4C1]|nr:hypothetical protein [Leptolyngbya sp. SIO4C1]
MSLAYRLVYENLVFFAIATAFLGLVGWAWRRAEPYKLPQPLPDWFKVWFLSVQIGGGAVPLMALGWCLWQGYSSAVAVLTGYFVMLGLQVLSESLSLRQFRSVVFVMVPYLYLPYRGWQLYEGIGLIAPELTWLRWLLIAEIVLWTVNYALDLAQLPRLLQWKLDETAS